MQYIVSCEQMKKAEELANKRGISYSSLMYNAGCAVYRAVREICGDTSRKNIVILAGNGNNGGDGFVAARKLKEDNANVTVVLMASLPKTVQAVDAFDLCRGMNVEILDLDIDQHMVYEHIKRADIVLDCVYGIGFHGSIPDKFHFIFNLVNKINTIKIAVDVPSGFDADTGAFDEKAINPDYTIILGAVKQGIYNTNKSKFGHIKVVDIGLEEDVFAESGYIGTISSLDDAKKLFPPRSKSSHKGDYGKLLNIAGSKNYIGAAILSTKAALRTGAGLCTLAAPQDVITAVSSVVPEAVYIPLEYSPQSLFTKEYLNKFTAISIGCGMGNTKKTADLVKHIINNSNCPIILDADGINCLASSINILKEASGRVILTPHPAEFSRITGKSVEKIQADRINCAMQFAKDYNCIVVLKGENTIIADKYGFAVNTTGNAGMATAGSGDVLTGIIAAIVSRGFNLMSSAAAGVYFHGLAGDKFAEKANMNSLIASDIIDELKYLL